MELIPAARRHLNDMEVVAGFVQDRVWKDRLEDLLDGTGQRAIVVKRGGGWAMPQPRNTQEYPLLQIQFWADHQRNDDQTIRVEDGLSSAMAMYRAVDPLLHGVRDQWWGATSSTTGMWVIGCQRYSEPMPLAENALAIGRPVPTDSDSFEAQCVVVNYAVQTVH